MPQCKSCKKLIEHAESDSFNERCVRCFDLLSEDVSELDEDEVLDSDLEDRDYGQERFE